MWKKLLSSGYAVCDRVLAPILDKTLPSPSPFEVALIKELRANILSLAPPAVQSPQNAEDLWLTFARRLRELTLKSDPRQFLRWDVIKRTMFADGLYITKELRHLRGRPDWQSRWEEAVAEDAAGYPKLLVFYPRSSGNLIHHAYHWSLFEEKIAKILPKLNVIFEFGGGYGSMCRLLVCNLKYRGKYLIFDLPEYAALQQYYLKSLNLPYCPPETFNLVNGAITCIADFDQLREMLQGAGANALFIGMWSISETPVAFRERLLALAASFDYFLLAFADNFSGVDNIAFFQEWRRRHREVGWLDWEIGHLPGNRYLMGARIRR